MTYSAAIDQHLVTPDDKVDCQHGSIDVFGMKIHDHESLGVITIAEALAHSSDVAAIKTGMKLGPDRLYHYIHDYGFGQQTGIELPGETRGMAKTVNHWSKVSIGAISMGQEIGVTPLQTISLISTIANDGVYTPPRIVAGELLPDSKALPVVFHPAQQHRVVSTMTAAEMKKMMEGVVLFGTARRAILDGYTVAGKTGTAQKVDPATGVYSKTKYVASFIGFSPVNSPAITIAVILDSPAGLHQGGQVCAPVFKRIAQQVLEYLHVPHDLDVKNPQRQQLTASAKDNDVDESSDHLGAPVQDDETAAAKPAPGSPKPAVETSTAPAATAVPVETEASNSGNHAGASYSALATGAGRASADKWNGSSGCRQRRDRAVVPGQAAAISGGDRAAVGAGDQCCRQRRRARAVARARQPIAVGTAHHGAVRALRRSSDRTRFRAIRSQEAAVLCGRK